MFIIKSDIFSVADLVPEKHFRKQAKPQMVNIKLDLNIGELPGFGGSDSGPNLQPLYKYPDLSKTQLFWGHSSPAIQVHSPFHCRVQWSLVTLEFGHRRFIVHVCYTAVFHPDPAGGFRTGGSQAWMMCVPRKTRGRFPKIWGDAGDRFYPWKSTQNSKFHHYFRKGLILIPKETSILLEIPKNPDSSLV